MHPTSPHLGSRYHQKHLTHLVNCICKPFVCLLIFVSYEMLLDVISDWLCGAPLSHLYVAYQPASVEHRVRSNHTKVNCETGKINFMKRQKNIVIKLTKTFQKCTNNIRDICDWQSRIHKCLIFIVVMCNVKLMLNI